MSDIYSLSSEAGRLIERAYERGKEDGKYEAHRRGLEEGEKIGYEKGYRDGYEKGLKDNKDDGFYTGVGVGLML